MCRGVADLQCIANDSFCQILMHERTPNRELDWVRSVPGRVPHQAVLFDRGNNSAMFVVRVNYGSYNIADSFVSGKKCPKSLTIFSQSVECAQTFDFLVLKHGELTTITHIIIVCNLILPDTPALFKC